MKNQFYSPLDNQNAKLSGRKLVLKDVPTNLIVLNQLSQFIILFVKTFYSQIKTIENLYLTTLF